MKGMYQPKVALPAKNPFQEIIAIFGWRALARARHTKIERSRTCSCIVNSLKNHCGSSWKLLKYKCVANFHPKKTWILH